MRYPRYYQDCTLRRSDLQKFSLWLGFFHAVNRRRKNKEFLTHYFFRKFTVSPPLFYAFLGYLKGYLLGTDEQERKRDIAAKYLDILSPLCERFNFFEERNFLNDACFKILDPEQYSLIQTQFSVHAKKSKHIIRRMLNAFDSLLRQKSFDYEINGRYKNLYSIFRKFQKYGQNAMAVNDIFAFRIILNTSDSQECFEVSNLLHDAFQPVPEFFKDYITIPKINGYQSLHTGIRHVLKHYDFPVEVQIRTREMHDFAETGMAAHWLYSQDKKSKLFSSHERLALERFSDKDDDDGLICCFTVHGDVVLVPKGSTLLDFAYQIHTHLGNGFQSAQVNGKMKKWSDTLREGDVVRIVSSSCNQVQAKWLQYVRTKYAYKKIADYLKSYGQKIEYPFRENKEKI